MNNDTQQKIQMPQISTVWYCLFLIDLLKKVWYMVEWLFDIIIWFCDFPLFLV